MSEQSDPSGRWTHRPLAAVVPERPSRPTAARRRLGRPLADLHQRHRPLQLPLQLPHAQGSVRLKDYPILPHAALLSFEEITRIARLFVAHGVPRSA